MRLSIPALVLSLLLVALALPVHAEDDVDVPDVVVLSITRGFRHGSIGHSHDVLTQMAADTGAFEIAAIIDNEASGSEADLTQDLLDDAEILLFANTTGEHEFSTEQRAAIQKFVTEGGGVMGFHSATDTNYEWDFYQELFGAAFTSHPHTGTATVRVENGDHPVHADTSEDSMSLNEEYYKWQSNPRYTQDIKVLLSLDVSTTGFFGSGALFPQYDEDQPLEWVKTYRGTGRVWYSALGHFDATYDRADFQGRFLNALDWVVNGFHDGGDEEPRPERGPGVPAVFNAPPNAQNDGFGPGPVMTQGGTGTLLVTDTTTHNVISVDVDAQGYPLFRSEFGIGETVPVEGVEDLPPGDYGYICNIHPNMSGVLTVLA